MQQFRVTIHYHEPAFEMRIGRSGAPYHFTFEVTAPNEGRAMRQARHQFQEMARLSSVGWVREIVRIEAELAGAA